jgi:hypothetical protein
MSEILDFLVKKYSLAAEPTSKQVQEWSNITETYIKDGMDPVEAGKIAANEVFENIIVIKFAKFIAEAHADDIKTILNMIKGQR